MALGPGSIAFTGFNADGSDNLAFVALEPIAAGTEIHFTDNEWRAGALNTGESAFTWTATGNIAAGTVVTLDQLNTTTAISNLGTITFTAGTLMDIGGADEIVYAYVGTPTVPTAFLAAIANDALTASSATLDGTGLTAGVTALTLTAIDADADIAAYNGPRIGPASYADYLPLINNPANWITQDTGNDDSMNGTAPDVPLSTAAFTDDPNAQVVNFAAGSLAVSQAEGNAATVTYTFTVERTGPTTGALSFSGAVLPSGTMSAADFDGGVLPTSFSGTIADGAAFATVTFTVTGDTQFEPDESFTLVLNSASNPAATAVFGDRVAATGTVTNDDAQPFKIAFVGFNADGPDNLAFAALTDIAAGTVIHFGNADWVGTGFTAGGSTWSWTAASDLAAGTIVTLDGLASGAAATSNHGAVAYSGPDNPDLADADEIVYAYLGGPGAPSAFLTAVANDTFTVNGATLSGTGLTAGVNAIQLSSRDADADIALYSGPRSTEASVAAYEALINNPTRWITQDAAGDQSADGSQPNAPFSAVPLVANTALGTGAIAFVGFNADGQDDLAFVTLKDLSVGTVINFTDKNWNGASFDAGESVWSWTAASDIAAGTVVTMNALSGASPSSNHGAIAYLESAEKDVGASTAGFDTVYAFTGTAENPTAFLAAVGNQNNVFSGTGMTGNGTGGNLVLNGDTSIYAGNSYGLAKFSDYLDQVNFAQNWLSQSTPNDDSSDGITPDAPFAAINFTAGSGGLAGGAIAFTGYNADGADALAFVALQALAAGTQIHFTDNEWNGSAFNTGESAWTWTAATDIAAGTVITMDALNGATPSSNRGAIQFTESTERDLSSGPEMVYAYVGAPSTPTAFLAAISNAQHTEATGTLAGTGLKAGVNAIVLSSSSASIDIAAYRGSHFNQASFAAYAAQISNVTNATWYRQGNANTSPADQAVESGDTLLPDLPFPTAPFTINPAAQVVSFAASSVNVSQAEGNSGPTLLTFTVERTGGTTGDVSFSGRVLPNLANLLGTNADISAQFVTAEDFGGTFPSFAGVIPEGASSATFTVAVAGDTLFETNDKFQLELQSATNPAAAAITIGTAFIATGTITNDDPQPTVIHSGETYTAPFTLTGNAHLMIESGGVLWPTPSYIAIYWGGPNANVVVDNAGFVTAEAQNGQYDSFYPVSTTATTTGSLTYNNLEGGLTRGVFSVGALAAGATATINNAGAMMAVYRPFDLKDAAKNGGLVTLNNLEGGLITQEYASSDMIRAGTNVVINNYGTILHGSAELGPNGASGFGGDGIDYQNYAGGKVHNFGSGLIIGGRHAITGDRPVEVINELGGLVIGNNGSAVNIDNGSQVSETVHVTNYGTMLGRSADESDSDGDAIDTDGLAFIENHGAIRGEGHNGYHDGEPNVSEGIAIGGGTINNYAGAEIYGYGRAIQVDNSENGPAFSATTIYNEGLIRGDGNAPTGVDAADVAPFTPMGNEAINLLGNWADTITNRGQIIGGVKMGGGDDTFNAYVGSSASSVIDGGDGNDTANLLGDGESAFGATVNVENLMVQEGSWTVATAVSYDAITIASGAAVTSALRREGASTLVIEQGAVLGNTAQLVMSGTSMALDNAGSIFKTEYGQAVTIGAEGEGTAATVWNREGAAITSLDTGSGGVIRVSGDAGTQIVFNNAGLIDGPARAFQANDFKGASFVLNNLATGVMRSAGEGETLRGKVTELNNAGLIMGGSEGFDYLSNRVTVHNLAGGWMEGNHHAVTGKVGVTVTNAAGATMIGRNGSAVNIDNNSAVENTAFVVNHGLMQGMSAETEDSDGDAIDVDGLVQLDNYGVVEGLGHNGYHKGEPNVSEGLAVGGGVVNNHAGATIYGYGRAIQADNSSNGAAKAATTIWNAGLIQGDGNGPTGVTPEEAALFADRIKGGEAINLLGDWNDTLTNEGEIIGGVKMGGGADVLTNSGTITATGGSAVDLGDGDDMLTNTGTIAGKILLGAGDDHLAGGAGVEDVTGGAGADLLSGGDGSDWYRYALGDGADTIVEGLGQQGDVDTLDLSGIDLATASFAFAGTDVRVTLADGGTVLLRDQSTGGGVENILFAGEQTLDRAAILQAAGLIQGTSGSNTLFGGNMGELVDAQGGNDYVFGRGGDDVLLGGEGADYLSGDAGNDHAEGGEGADLMFGGEGDDVLDGGAGADYASGGAGNDQLLGGEGADVLYGGAGNDLLQGGAGDDLLYGDAGQDVLEGGAGNDRLSGGANEDAFVFGAGFGKDTVTDYQVGEDVTFKDGLLADFADFLAHATQQGADVLIAVDAQQSVLLKNVALANLQADDFHFQAA